MKYEKYLKLAMRYFPEANFDKIPNFTKPEIVKKVAEYLFVASDINSELAKETRHQLKYLYSKGIHDFE